jgi:hypothetical protein
LKRKETSIYKPTDLWTTEDDLLFLKFCPSKRMKCYHAMARDTSCRPHELLKLRIKDIVFLKQQQQAQNNHQQQQQLHSQVILPPTTTTASSHQRQVPNNISRRDNLGSQKMIPWKLLSSLLSTQRNQHTLWW